MSDVPAIDWYVTQEIARKVAEYEKEHGKLPTREWRKEQFRITCEMTRGDYIDNTNQFRVQLLGAFKRAELLRGIPDDLRDSPRR